MKNIKNLLAMLLALSMVLCLFACSKDETTPSTTTTANTTDPQGTEPQGTEPQQSEPENNEGDTTEPVNYVYTVTVVDGNGNPVSGVPVQICAGTTCVPKITDANGVAGYDSEITGNDKLTAKIIKVPEGYTAEATEIIMEGLSEVEFILQAENGSETNAVTYTIVVLERDDNPHTGLKVLITDEAGNSIEGFTDENGEAVFTAEDISTLAEGIHTACIAELPENFDYYECEDSIVVDAENAVATFVIVSNT